jgi:glutaredoxin
MLSKLRKQFGQNAERTRVPRVLLYTRQGCHLCDEAKELLHKLESEERFELAIIDVDDNEELRAEFNYDVPVIYIDGRKAFKHRIDARKFLKSLRSRAT